MKTRLQPSDAAWAPGRVRATTVGALPAARFYWTYATRSLRRGGQRTLFAIFCIAVGVMAIVALQLASLMVSNDLTSNVRAANGGDISVRQDIVPFRQADLPFFSDLKRRGLATGVTAVTDDRGIAYHGTHTYPVIIGVVDAAQFPLVGQPDFTRPAHGDLHRLLSSPYATVLSTAAAGGLHVTPGDQVTLNGANGRTLTARVTGLVRSGGLSGGVDAYVQRTAYQRSSFAPLTYNAVYLTTPGDAQTRTAATRIQQRFPLAMVETVADALKARQDQTTLLHRLLEVVGLVALLIGGFGVVNTMNVLLARRRVEIAMLKTAGYRRRDLYALFGLEAAVLGVAGGVAGALIGIALSAGVKTLIENAFLLQLPFAVDPPSVLMGVVVGLCTAIIFGLLPIVRAALVRPQAVLRDVPERASWESRLGSAGLVLLLSVLFCVLASVILGSALWGIAMVYGTFIALGVLSVAFGAIVWIVGKLPVPERLTVRQTLLATIGLLVAVGCFLALPAVGILLILAALLGYAVAFLPRPWKATIKMSLRDIGRQRTRATMTLLALFVGVFSVGLIVVLGQDVRDKFQSALATVLDYNVVSIMPAQFAGEYERQLGRVPGLRKSQAINAAATVPVAVNGRPLSRLFAERHASRQGTRSDLGVEGTLAFLSGLSGYNLGHQSTDATIPKGEGRNLDAADAETANVLLPTFLHTLRPLRLQLGDRITLSDVTRTQTLTVRVVGFYTSSLFLNTREPILASRRLVHNFAGAEEQLIYSLKVDPQKADHAVERLNHGAPHTITLNLTSLGIIVDQVLGNLVVLLVALASLALFAGIVIIANAVALAMLERRREQAVLKSVGYTSGRVLADVLVENGVIGGLGGVLGMILVAVATTVLAKTVFKTSLAIPAPTTLGLIILVVAIALATSALVSWAAVRFRPAEVLRYE